MQGGLGRGAFVAHQVSIYGHVGRTPTMTLALTGLAGSREIVPESERPYDAGPALTYRPPGRLR